MSKYHVTKPILPERKFGYIGEAPSAANTGRSLVASERYLRSWQKGLNWFTYSAPPHPSIAGSGDFDGLFHIILWSPTRTDTSKTNRLCGMAIPWSYSSTGDILWKEGLAGSYASVVPSGLSYDGMTMNYGARLSTPYIVELYHEDFDWTPPSGGSEGDFDWGVLKTENMTLAALCIGPAPDDDLTDDQAVHHTSHFAPGKAIRGYDDGTEVPSIGTMIEYMKAEDETTMSEDRTDEATRRCLFQSGHPGGIYKGASAGVYEDISDGVILVQPRNLGGYKTDITCYPACVVGVRNQAGAEKAYIRYTAGISGDTWTHEITTDDPVTAVHSGELDIDPGGDTIKIELACDNGGIEMSLKTWSLWEPGPESG